MLNKALQVGQCTTVVSRVTNDIKIDRKRFICSASIRSAYRSTAVASPAADHACHALQGWNVKSLTRRQRVANPPVIIAGEGAADD